MPVQANPLYGDTGAGVSRFGIAGDPRRMYPVGAAGGLFSVERLGQLQVSGSAYSYFTGTYPALTVTNVKGSRNMISNGDALYSMGAPEIFGGIIALRLGVTGTTGGNTIPGSDDPYGHVVARDFFNSSITPRAFYWGGDIIYQQTNATTGSIGASVEAFTTNVGGTVTVGSGSTSVTGNGTTFTTASLAGAYAYTPSKTLLQGGMDLILITLNSGSKSLHRISGVNAASGAGALTISPAIPSAATTQPYVLYRSGYGVSGMGNSSVIPIEVNDDIYIYYVGTVSPDTGGVIQAAKVPAAGGAWPHYTSPQSGASDIKATDIAYYKNFMLYGFKNAIGWSVAGFPTSVTTGFGATDFPSANITVVDNTDVFRGFEYLGDQLIAIFENSLWLVQATGTVPEFNFYKLPEATGAYFKDIGVVPKRRPFCSGRGAIFYWSRSGVMMLTGGTARNISLPIWSAIQLLFNANQAPNFTWEPTTDSVFVTNSTQEGFVYNVPTDTWSYMNLNDITGDNYHGFTGNGYPFASTMASAVYDSILERLAWHDATVGGPWYPASSRFVGISSTWATPIIILGDEYDFFPVAGFQLDGVLGDNDGTYQVYGGPSPYNLSVVESGTVTANDNRKLLGNKFDYPFMAIVFQFTSLTSTTGVTLRGVNLYPEGRGK